MKVITIAIVIALVAGAWYVGIQAGSQVEQVANEVRPTVEATPIVSGTVTLRQRMHVDTPVRGERGLVITEWDRVLPCRGSGGYDDLRNGTQVVVRDGSGNVLGTGALGQGLVVQETRYCEWSFTVPLNGRADFYVVNVSHRNGPTYSHDAMVAMGWSPELGIG